MMMMKIEHIYTERKCLVVDANSGEVLATYPLGIRKASAEVPTVFLSECKNEDNLVAVAKESGNNRRKCYEWLELFQKEELWLHAKYKHKKCLTKPVVALLEQLIEGVLTHNTIIVQRQELADYLDVKVGHLNRKLECLTKRGLAKTDTKGCSKGYIRIDLHPQLVFRGTLQQKEYATVDWCKANTEASNNDHLYNPKQGNRWSRAKYKPVYTEYDEFEVDSVRRGKLKSSNMAKLMFLTNQEFKNFLSGDLTL